MSYGDEICYSQVFYMNSSPSLLSSLGRQNSLESIRAGGNGDPQANNWTPAFAGVTDLAGVTRLIEE